MNLEKYFERVVVVSLKRRPDRLAKFWDRLNTVGWPFKRPEVFEAIDGNLVPTPSGVGGVNRWNSGGGAWGCMQSHRQILENCLMHQVSSVLVLEDDAWPIDDFPSKIEQFLKEVPEDWEGMMLGGQHFGHVPEVKSGILKCQNCQRTHAYVARGKYLRDLYALWHSYFGHCDHVMGPFQARYNVYSPSPFLIAQGINQSDITGRLEPRRLWSGSDIKTQLIYLKTSRQVVRELWAHGIHTGYSRNLTTDMDKGLEDIFYGNHSYINKVRKLRWWADIVTGEASAFEDGLAAIWIPNPREEDEQVILKAFGPEVIKFQVETAEEFLQNRNTYFPLTVAAIPCVECEAARKAREQQGSAVA